MNPWWSNCILLLFFSFLTIGSYSQSKEELEKKKANLKKDIAFKNSLLEETTENKKTSLNQLVILNKKIREREELIATIKDEIILINKNIRENVEIIAALESDIDRLKEEYADMIRFAYKSQNNLDKLLFIFASDDFNQAYKRIRYLQQYSDYRKKQVANIERKESTLKQRNELLRAKKTEKEELLESEATEREQLSQEKTEQNEVYAELSNKEKELRREIDKKKAEQEALQKALEKLIEEAIKASSDNKSSSKFVLTPEAKALAENFSSNKGKLPWPVEEGVIVSNFGINRHEVLKEVKINNTGVTIGTSQNAKVRAVFEGEVSAIIRIPGAGKTVMIRHGDFISAYGNLNEVLVKKGDKVKTKQFIGTVLTTNNKSEVQFELRQTFDILNPEYWLFNAR